MILFPSLSISGKGQAAPPWATVGDLLAPFRRPCFLPFFLFSFGGSCAHGVAHFVAALGFWLPSFLIFPSWSGLRPLCCCAWWPPLGFPLRLANLAALVGVQCVPVVDLSAFPASCMSREGGALEL